MAGIGGKRQGAGRKHGSKDTLKREDIQDLKPRLLALLDSIINEVESVDKLSMKVLVFEKVAPYILRKQPQDIDVVSDGKPISTVEWVEAPYRAHERSNENQASVN